MKIKIQNKFPISNFQFPIGRNGVHCGKAIANAFTLVEMLLVVMIIGILAVADINGGIKSALGAYEVDNGFYPKSLQDLLVQPANAKNWHGPYLDKLPTDPWGNPYIYYYPGKHSANSYDLLSTGPSGKEGNEDNIVSWAK